MKIYDFKILLEPDETGVRGQLSIASGVLFSRGYD